MDALLERNRREVVMRTRAGAITAAALTLTTSVFLLSFPSHGQLSTATITAFADQAGTSCTLFDDSEKTFDVYIINTITPGFGLAGSRFRVATSPGFSAAFVEEQIPFLHSGSVRDGVTVVYGTCLPGTFLLATVTFLGHGTSAPCSAIEVVAHPESHYPGSIDVMDCHFDWLPAPTKGPLLVNAVEGQCAPWCIVALEPTTWGAVKALYR
jgi:hypothetical protein